MSWLKNNSFSGTLGKLRSSHSPSPAKECDPSACYASFQKHWQQIYEIIARTKTSAVKQDDILGVVNNLKQLMMLLLLELQYSQTNKPCLDYLLSQNLLDKLFNWGEITGMYGNTIKMQQLQLFEILVSYSRTQLLIHESVHRPLIKLLESCSNEVFSVDIEKCLIILLNQLCICLIHHNELLELFFFVGENNQPSRFIIFSLLLPYLHRDGSLGQQARDALLLCIRISKQNDDVAEYIARHSNVMAGGLCGLYSALPRKLTIEAPDWYRFTPDDVNDMTDLAHFMNSLEFCNAAAEVAHPIVRSELLQIIYVAFLIPVMGPALLQENMGLTFEGFGYGTPLQLLKSIINSVVGNSFENAEEELTAATAYFDLFIRSLTKSGLLPTFIQFILKDKYEEHRIIDCLIKRIKSKSRLCIVTLALFETLIDLNCEDVMLELVLRHLVPCTHVMLSQRSRVSHIDPYCRSAEKFLSLAPTIPSRTEIMEGSLYGDYQAYLFDARNKINLCAMATSCWTYSYDGENPPHTGLPTRPEDLTVQKSHNINNNNNSNNNCVENETDPHSLPSADDGSSGYESFAFKDSGRECESGGECDSPCGSGSGGDIPETSCANNNSTSGNNVNNNNNNNNTVDNSCVNNTNINRNYSSSSNNSSSSPNKQSSSNCILAFRKPPSVYMNIFNSTPCIGPFLDVLFAKLEHMLEHDLYVNLRLTGLVSRLAIYPQPLVHSFLLDHSLVFQPSIRSLFQVLGALKQKIEDKLSKEPNVHSVITEAQNFLLEREERLVNARKHALEAPASLPPNINKSTSDPFDRSDGKRRSFSLALSSVFKRQQNQSNNNKDISSSPMYRLSGRGSEIKNVVMCAVILDEWVKELAAITQEHTVLRTCL
ncbi:FHIP family protein AGAP011705 isoform X3 [Lycorma delicatula]|uniref:FHIP family protein AGAP011705 isoform X3 n=1 Tax=Lycorma delicatula TaxID=130591 RepID=UPI003F518F29